MRLVRLGEFRKPIGKQGEHGVTRVEIDVSELIRDLPGGMPIIMFERGDGLKYPVETHMDGNIVWFVPELTETYVAGNNSVEVYWHVTDNLGKSVTYAVDIKKSSNSTESPDIPGETWVAQIANMVQTISAKVDEAVPEGGDEGQVLTKHNGANVWADPQGGGGGTSDHRQLTNRDANNQHPINAIEGLRAELDSKQGTINDLSSIRTGATAGATAYQKPSGGIPKDDLAAAVQTSLGRADSALQSFTETDPTVPAWAKTTTKPTYTAEEVGALPSDTSIPSKTSDLTNDSGYITEDDVSEEVYIGNTEPEDAKIWIDTSTTGVTTSPNVRWDVSQNISNTGKSTARNNIGAASQSDMEATQSSIADIDTIRSGAAAGATAVQPSTLNSYATQTYVNQQIAAEIGDAIGGEY